ncbi:putative malate dehydrogenase 1B [Watersipora subatra]|uniref:putative malate dehydrogenase 1B n=1 Tax=Watersipora subatra TaxID=2589382 RepID=UPI00355C04CF
MAKFVIAGKADCPYYAKVELLADQLVNSVGSFRVHKIVKTPKEWESWLQEECEKRKFLYQKSPIVWRELVDRGGKGILVGGVNEFQEYALEYYGVKSSLLTSDVTKIAVENMATKIEINKELQQYDSLSKPMNICITNAGSPISYHMLNAIASGEVFGSDTELTVNLLGSEEDIDSLKGVSMEAMDLARNLLRRFNVFSNPEEALRDCEAVIVLDQLIRQEEEAEDSWLKRNAEMFVQRIKDIDRVCKPTAKVLLAGGGPTNTSLYLMLECVKNIDKRNIVIMPSLIENQAKAILARKLKVKTSDVVDVIIWGDNEKYFCDTTQARVHNHDGPIWGPPSYSRLANILIHEEQWLTKDFPESLLTRYEEQKVKMGHIPAFAHAAAVNTLIKHWWFGSPSDQIISLGVVSEGWYDVPEGLVFSFPVRIGPEGQYAIVHDLNIPETSKQGIKQCVDYLMEQRYQLFPDQRPPPPPEPVKPEEVTDSPHPPTMTPIREETDIELRPSGEEIETETTPTHTDTDALRTTSAEAGLAKIQEDTEPPEDTTVVVDNEGEQATEEATERAADAGVAADQ